MRQIDPCKKKIRELGNSIYLDLEVVSDLNKLNDPEDFLRANQNKLVCLDEIQRKPEIFPLIRGLTDITRGLHHAMQDLNITEAYIVAPLPEETTYPYREGVTVTTIAQLPGLIDNL